VAEGTPEDIAKSKDSYTGRFLKEVLARRPLKKDKKVTREAAE
jgi:excinuclease ABC subunit A